MALANSRSGFRILLFTTVFSIYFGRARSHLLSRSVTFYHEVPVLHYTDFTNVNLIQHDVARQVVFIQWSFLAKTHSFCSLTNITVVMQPGGLPLIAPHNESFPANFFVHRTSQHSVVVPTDGKVTTFDLHHPLHGSWFAVTYRKDEQKKIKILRTCEPTLQINVTTWISRDAIRQMGTNHVTKIELHRNISYFSFYSRVNTWRHRLRVSSCLVGGVVNFRCPVSLYARSQALPDNSSETETINCTASSSCHLMLTQPKVNEWIYLMVERNVNENVTLDLSDFTDDCVHFSVNATDTCDRVAPLERVENTLADFSIVYTISMNTDMEVAKLVDSRPTIVQFDVAPLKDTGGTLLVRVALIQEEESTPSAKAHDTLVSICLQRGVIPTNGSDVTCPYKDRLQLANLDEGNMSRSVQRYLPYPESGAWFLGLQSFCYNKTTGEHHVCVNQTTKVSLMVTSSACVEGACAGHGRCRLFYKGVFLMSSCQCYSGWRGYGCTDDSQCKSLATQLTYTLVLVLSNIAFLPAVILALYRRHIVEAIIYAANMVFSALYHACDMRTWSVYRACAMPYNVLSYADFFLSIMSFVVTLIAMAERPAHQSAPLHFVAVVFLIIAVEWRKHSLITFFVPCAFGVIIVAATWGYRSYKNHACYPGKWRLLRLAPGAVIAVVGMIVFAFVETQANYPYTHSAWHVCMSTSIVFLLPQQRRKRKDEGTSSEFELSGVGDAEGVGLVSADGLADTIGSEELTASRNRAKDDIIL